MDEQKPELCPGLPRLTAPSGAQLGPEEVEDEGLCSPHISFLGVREEDERDEDSDAEDSGIAHGPPGISFASEQSLKSVELHTLHSTE